MEDKVVFTVTRTEVADTLGRDLTDVEWQAMAFEIGDFLQHYTTDEVPRLLDDLDSIVEEYTEET